MTTPRLIRQYGRVSEKSLQDFIYILNKNKNYIIEIIRYDGLYKYFLASYASTVMNEYSGKTLHYFTQAYLWFNDGVPVRYKHDDTDNHPYLLNDIPEQECYYYIHKYNKGFIPITAGDLSTQNYENSALNKLDLVNPMVVYI